MKTIILISLVLMVKAHAQIQYPVIPYVNNFGFSAQVQVSNQNAYYVSCSGPVYLQMSSGSTDMQYYFETVSPRGMSYRQLYPMRTRPNDRINYIHHSIFCNKR